MAGLGGVAEDMVSWLESEEAVNQNPEAERLKQYLLEIVATKKRRQSLTGSDTNVSSRRLSGSSSGSSRPVINTARYKTELCRSFSENGFCRYGDKCQFAHGATELRPTTRHPRYKTELCKAYHTTGFCAYGARCNFIHKDMECVEANTVHVLPHAITVTESVRLLGSTVDSPPQSVTSSPTPSPTAMLFDSTLDSLPTLLTLIAYSRPPSVNSSGYDSVPGDFAYF